ncbi:MAG: dihydrodipicolinate synthase/N-acetylneuraminate lyase [Proteobacteria bacterium]|nr:dihydrodipicolinate synthase/N-acetylneuraminate lyase [Pseudomonadota bacterium]
MTASSPIRGLWCASLTPVEQGAGIDCAEFVAHVRALLASGVDGIVPFGTTGEGPSFSVDERRKGLEALLGAGIAPSSVAVATGCAAFTDTLALTRHALESGCPRCLVMPPFFWKNLANEAVFCFYAGLIETLGDSRLRLYLYHIPQLSAVAVAPEVVGRLARAYPETIAGVKDSSGDFENTARLLAVVPQLSILVGHEPHLPRSMRAGGAGTICGIANVYPRLVAALLQPDRSSDAQARIRRLLEIIRNYPMVPALKAIRAAQAVDEAHWLAVRPPLRPLAAVERQDLLESLKPFAAP